MVVYVYAGFSEHTMNQPTKALSGGWAMRAALASALFVTPDLLLLDEVNALYSQQIIRQFDGRLVHLSNICILSYVFVCASLPTILISTL